MKESKFGLGLEDILERPLDLLVLRGAEDDDTSDSDDDSDGGNGEGEDNDNDTDTDGEGDTDGENEDGSESNPLAPKVKALTEERERHYARRKAAEKRVTDLEAEIATLKTGGATDKVVAEELKVATETAEKLQKTNKDLALRVAFLEDNTHQWKSPAAAMKLADLSAVEIDEDGSVHGLTEALDALAASDAYLLQDKKQIPKRKTGDPVPPKDKSPKLNESKLRSKYPALRR